MDLNESDFFRKHWPFLRDRRIDSYQPIKKRFIDEISMKKLFSLIALIGSFAFGQIKPIQIDPINNNLFVYQTFNIV